MVLWVTPHGFIDGWRARMKKKTEKKTIRWILMKQKIQQHHDDDDDDDDDDESEEGEADAI